METATKNTFTKWKQIIFSAQGVSIALGTIMMGWVTLFATDYLGISAATVGLLFMASKIFDGFTDIIAGFVIDKAHSRLGKGRPFDLAVIGYWGCMVLIFAAPIMSYSASCAYLFIMYTLVNSVFLTLLNCSTPVYLANVVDRPEQTLTIGTIGGVISFVVAMVGGVLLPQMIKTLGATREGWSKIALILAVPAVIIGLLRFFIVKEKMNRENAAAAQSFSLKEMIRVIAQNKYILIFALIIFVSNAGNNFISGVQNYYCIYILGSVEIVSLLSLTMASSIVSIVLTPILSKKFGFSRIMRVFTLLGMAGFLLRLIAPSSLTMIICTSLLTSLVFNTVWTFANTFIVDCMDYGEWKTGIRSEGSIACVQSVTAKIGTAVGTGIVGVLMGASGYSGGLAVQPDSAINMLIALFSYVPAIFCLLQYILLRFYNLDEKLPQIRAELAARRENKNN